MHSYRKASYIRSSRPQTLVQEEFNVEFVSEARTIGLNGSIPQRHIGVSTAYSPKLLVYGALSY